MSKAGISTELLPPSQGERVARAERQLAIAQQIAHMGSWDWDVATNAVTWSDELYRIYGLEPGSCEVTFESFLSRLLPDDRARIEGEVAAALQRGGRFAYEERILRPDGTMRILDTVGEVRRDKSGKTTGLIGTCRDVTEERKRDEQIRRYAELEDAEKRVLESLADGAPLIDVLSRLVRAVEAHSPPAIGAIHLRDPEEGRYPARVSPSLVVEPSVLHVYALAPILASDDRDLGDFVLYVQEPRPLTDDDTKVLERASNLSRIAIERRQLEDQLRELSAHVESVREDERTGIAREIHDVLGQALTALKMDIAWIARRSSSEAGLAGDALQEKLAAMSKMTDEIIGQVRRISAELRPGVLDDLGLVAAIEWQASEFEARTGTSCVVRCKEGDSMLDPEASTQVFRIFQEALTNVTRHAEAKHVEVRLGTHDEWFVMEVHDDGKGIAPNAARSPKALGLLGIRERARRLGGSVSVERGAASGTTLLLKVPRARLTPIAVLPGSGR